MSTISATDKLHLNESVGWLELGNWFEANDSLDNITPANRAHVDVLQVRTKIYAAAGKWNYVAEVANSLCALQPQLSFGPVHLAEALRQLGRFDQAKAALVAVADKFNEDWQLAFLLARLCCKLGEKAEALQWLEHAIDVAGKKDIRLIALEEPDLQNVWVDVSEI